MIKFKNKNMERETETETETEIRYLTYMSDNTYSCNDGVKHLRYAIQKIMSDAENNKKYLNEIVFANVIPRVYGCTTTGTNYYVSLIVKRTYYTDMYESLYAFNRALEEKEIKL